MTDYLVASIVAAMFSAMIAAIALGAVIARMGFPLIDQRNRFGCLDGLRGFLALSVMMHHFVIWIGVSRLGLSWTAPAINFFNSLGSFGVGLFFMTTGFVFYPRIRAGMRATDWTHVYASRLFRILPLTAFSVALILTIVLIRLNGHVLFEPATFVKHTVEWLVAFRSPDLLGYKETGRINAYVLWTLYYEWLFYFLVLPTLALLRDSMPRSWPSWSLPATFLTSALLLRPFADWAPSLIYMPLFAVGMIANEIATADGIAARLRGKGVAIAAIGGLLIAMILTRDPYTPVPLLLAGVFFCTVAAGNDLFGLLRLRGALVLGEISFGVYLMHGIVLDMIFTNGAGGLSLPLLPALLPIAAMIVVAMTATTFLLVERPAIQLGKKTQARLTRRNTP